MYAVKRNALAARLHHAYMVSFQVARVNAATRMRDHVDFLAHVDGVVGHTNVFFFDDQATLQAPVMACHAGRARVGMAPQRLNTAQREHEAARRRDEISADAQRPGSVSRGYHFAAGNHLDPLLEAGFHQAIDHLKDEFRLVFVMHDIEGYKHHEIAAALALPEGTSKTRLARARELLREMLAQSDGGFAQEEGL